MSEEAAFEDLLDYMDKDDAARDFPFQNSNAWKTACGAYGQSQHLSNSS